MMAFIAAFNPARASRTRPSMVETRASYVGVVCKECPFVILVALLSFDSSVCSFFMSNSLLRCEQKAIRPPSPPVGVGLKASPSAFHAASTCRLCTKWQSPDASVHPPSRGWIVRICGLWGQGEALASSYFILLA